MIDTKPQGINERVAVLEAKVRLISLTLKGVIAAIFFELLASWWITPARSQTIIYGIAPIEVIRWSSDGARFDSLVAVGAQVNASNGPGVPQIAFGIATEARAFPGSFSRLVGIEASAINQEPANSMRKIGAWLTFKNRLDVDYWTGFHLDPANENSQALRIEGETGTGWSRGVVFGSTALHRSRDQVRPAAIDFSELTLEQLGATDLIRFPDGCSLVYAGRGQLLTRCGP